MVVRPTTWVVLYINVFLLSFLWFVFIVCEFVTMHVGSFIVVFNTTTIQRTFPKLLCFFFAFVTLLSLSGLFTIISTIEFEKL